MTNKIASRKKGDRAEDKEKREDKAPAAAVQITEGRGSVPKRDEERFAKCSAQVNYREV